MKAHHFEAYGYCFLILQLHSNLKYELEEFDVLYGRLGRDFKVISSQHGDGDEHCKVQYIFLFIGILDCCTAKTISYFKSTSAQ